MSDEFVVSIYFVQAMDNVSTLIDLCKYSHPFARVLTHSDESTYIFRLHGWHATPSRLSRPENSCIAMHKYNFQEVPLSGTKSST